MHSNQPFSAIEINRGKSNKEKREKIPVSLILVESLVLVVGSRKNDKRDELSSRERIGEERANQDALPVAINKKL